MVVLIKINVVGIQAHFYFSGAFRGEIK